MRTTVGSAIRGEDGGRRGGDRKREQERGAAGGRILGPDSAAVGADDALADREAESGPLAVGRRAPVELLEHAPLVAGVEAAAVIRHLHGDVLLRRGRDDVDRAPRWRVLD